MKTIMALRDTKEFKKGEIRRVDDKTANMMVGLVWGYISKSEWKNETRGPKDIETKEKPKPSKNEKGSKKS